MTCGSIDGPKIMAVFEDGMPHTLRDVAVACNIHTRMVAWFLAAMARRGKLQRLPTPRGADSPVYCA